MAIGDVAVRVVPDAERFWTDFRSRTAGQANAAGKHAGEEFRRGLEGALTRPVKIRADADLAGVRAQLAALGADTIKAKVEIKVDQAAVRAQLAALGVGAIDVRINIDAARVRSEIAALQIGSIDANVKARFDPAQVREELQKIGPLSVKVVADLDAARLRADLAALRGGTVRVRAEADTSRARAEISSLSQEGQKSGAGLLAALIPLAPALFPLAGAALAAGSGLAVLGGAGVLAVTGLNRELHSTTGTGRRAAASVGLIKGELHSLQATAAKAALPGLEASVLTIRRELPALRQVIGDQASVAGQVIAHLTSGIVGGFSTFRPIISAVGADVDTLAAHFDAFANGPGGAHFAKTLATNYADVKPVIESVVRAFADIARAASSGGLGILHIIGEVANVIDSFPTPVLTAIVDGFLAFRAVGLASTAISGVGRALDRAKSAAAGVAAATQLAATQRIAAEAEVAAATSAAEAEIATAMLATAEAAQAARLELILSGDSVTAAERAQLEAQAVAADAQIAQYEAVAAAAQAAALEQAAAAEAAAGAVASSRATGAGSLLGTFGKVLGPLALVGAALPLLSGAFGDNGQAAQQAAQQVDGYTSALVASKGAIDGTIRSQVAKNLGDTGALHIAAANGVAQSQLVDAVLAGGTALTDVIGKVDAHARATGAGTLSIDAFNGAVRAQSKEFAQSARAAADQTAAVQHVTAAQRAHAAAMHTDVASYLAATEAAAKSVDKTREQTVAFQLENDAASLLSQALKGLAGQNLDVAQAQTGFAQSTNSAVAALKKGKDAITGHSDAALADQQAIQGSVSAARQLADAVAKQTGSSDKAAASYRNSRNALLSQLKAQGVLTPAVRKYINTLFDVKGVSDYLTKHPTKHDVQVATAAAEAKIRAAQAKIDGIRQGRKPDIGIDSIAAFNAIQRLQAVIDALHGKTVVISTITPDGSSINVGNQGRGFGLATGGPVHGPGTGTSDSIPAWLSNGEYVVNAKATAKHRHLLESINKGARGFAGGGAVGNAQQIASGLRSAFGLSGNQIAGILGNLKVESNFNPRAYNAHENAHGFAQWEGPRWTALQRFAAHLGESALSTHAQVQFLVHELRGSGLVPQIRRMKDPGQVAAFVDARYERSSGSTRQARMDAARSIARSGVAGGSGGGSDVGSITHSGKDWIFNGHRYASERAALNAQTAAQSKSAKVVPTRIQNLIGAVGQSSSPPFNINQQGFRAISAQISRAQRALLSWHAPLEKTRKYEQEIIRLSTILQHQLQRLRIKIDGSDLAAIKSAIGGTADQMRTSFQTLITDMKNAGASAAQLARARRREAAVVTANNRYTSARDYASGIRGTLAGAFDPTHFGSVTDLIAGYQGQTGQNKAYANELTALRKRAGKNKQALGLINTLAASGQTSTLEALASGSAADLSNAAKAYQGYNASLGTGADAATQAKFGGKTAQQLHDDVEKQVHTTDKLIRAITHLAGAVGGSVKHSHHHTQAQIDQALAELQTIAHHGRN